MQKVIEFIKNFIEDEYRLLIQLESEPNTSLIEDNLEKLNDYFSGLDSSLHIPSTRILDSLENVTKQFQPRLLFAVEEYNNPRLGKIFRVFTSSAFHGDTDYFSSFFVIDTHHGLKIVSRYNICNECNGTGQRSGVLCSLCKGFGWNWRGGEKIETLGELLASQKLTQRIVLA